jgi:S-disulfanyl-L-cysteine oxidoreductase SoxD
MSRWLTILAASSFVTSVGATEDTAVSLGIGRAATVHEIVEKDLTILPDGTGLPEGKGIAAAGASIFAVHCAACHGDKGQGLGDFPALVGGRGTLSTEKPVLTVGSYWPYATTIFDYIRRAMPYQAAGELTADETYALTAWILAQNKIINASDVIDRHTLPAVKMPNRNGFVPDPRPDVPAARQ